MRVHPRGFAAFVVVVASGLNAFARADFTILLRGNEQAVTATSVSSSLRGIEARPAGTVIPWDMVRAVEVSTGVDSNDAALNELLATGKDLWRARIRIERGDEALAQPLLVKHWERFRLNDGPTTALVAEGMLRCALASGDIRGAVEPWLVCLRIGSAGEPSRFSQLPLVMDDATGLLPALSPFVPAAKRADLAAACVAVNVSPAGTAGMPQEVAARIARMVAATDGVAIQLMPLSADAAPAVRALGLLEAILVAADARACTRATAEFDRAFAEQPAYLTAWKLAAVGTQEARIARASKPTQATGSPASADHNRALERAALALLAVPASGLDHSGLVDLYAFEEAESLLRESGDTASALQVAALREERLRELEPKNKAARK